MREHFRLPEMCHGRNALQQRRTQGRAHLVVGQAAGRLTAHLSSQANDQSASESRTILCLKQHSIGNGKYNKQPPLTVLTDSAKHAARFLSFLLDM